MAAEPSRIVNRYHTIVAPNLPHQYCFDKMHQKKSQKRIYAIKHNNVCLLSFPLKDYIERLESGLTPFI